MRQHIDHNTRLWVVKIGSSILTNHGQGVDVAAIQQWTLQMAQLHQQGYRFVIVSSGAVAAGMSKLSWTDRPSSVHQLQAAAAVGQMGLIQAYENAFQTHGIKTAQILLDHDDLSDRRRYLNARATLRTLLDLDVVPVVNENDTVTTDEIRFGDNDTLSALVASLVEAQMLVLLTDQGGLFTADPRKDSTAQLISEKSASDASLDAMVSDGGKLGRGGMITKLKAARLAARSGTHCAIVNGKADAVITRLCAGESFGTLLYADQPPQAARKRWLAGQLQLRGRLTLDQGASSVLTQRGSSLLPVGVKTVQGNFQRGDLVACVDLKGHEIARGLINYNHEETQRIKGKPSTQIEVLLGYKNEDELIHRDNLVLMASL